MRIAPESSGTVPATAPKSVLFPDPFVPTTTTNDPAAIESVMPSTARTTGPPGLANCTTA